jgi:hypothetical protein
MFPDLQIEVMERFTAVEQYFRNSPKEFRGIPPELTQTPKGLVLLQIYAIYEYTVREVTGTAIEEIAKHAHAYADLRHSLLAIFLEPEISSLRNCGDKNDWLRRLELLQKLTSPAPITAVATIPFDGSHYRHTHVELILRVLGVKRTLTRRKRHLYQIDTLVDKRNSISHGDETAMDVGRLSSRADIMREIRVMKSICLRLIEIVSEHCSMPDRQLQ